MRHVQSPYEGGTILVAQDHLGRYNQFEACLEAVQAPIGTVLIRVPSGSCAYGCNLGVRNRRGAWVWFIDDDHTFAPDILLKLLAHDKDLVAPVVPMRYTPFELVLYKQLEFYDNGRGGTGFRSDYYRLADLGKQHGLIEVAGLPKAGLLAREAVWAKLPDPWFKVGRIKPDEIDDDRLFMWEARQAGFTLWADLDLDLTHMRTVALRARRDADGRFKLSADLDNVTLDLVR